MQCQIKGSHAQVDVLSKYLSTNHKSEMRISYFQVIYDEFQSDTRMLAHRYIPRRWITTIVERFMYERAQEIREDPKYADAVVRKLWQDMLDAFPIMSDLSKLPLCPFSFLLSFAYLRISALEEIKD